MDDINVYELCILLEVIQLCLPCNILTSTKRQSQGAIVLATPIAMHVPSFSSFNNLRATLIKPYQVINQTQNQPNQILL